jgi:hypothetical protein
MKMGASFWEGSLWVQFWGKEGEGMEVVKRA